MKFTAIKPCIELSPFIHNFWELKGDENDQQWERNFPDGCPGVVINLGDTCKTDNGLVAMQHGKTYVVGTMTSFKDSFIDANTHLLGVCMKPSIFQNFYSYAPQNELINCTVEFERSHSFNAEKIIKDPINYFNQFFIERRRNTDRQLQAVLDDIHQANRQPGIYEVAKRNFITVKQLERKFKTHIGITPKEYANIVRFQHALSMIRNSSGKQSLADIAFDCGFYDHSHLSNEIKRNTGLTPSEL